MKSLLIDLDGVLRIGDKPAEGIQEFLNFINRYEIPACIISNSTLAHSKEIQKFFTDNSIDCKIKIMTAADASLKYVEENYKRVSVYCKDSVKEIFNHYLDYENPEAVLVGDLKKSWTYEILNDIFKKVFNGADFIAMQKNRFWKTPEDGLLLDAGAFIKGIEYATGKEARLIGKPSPIYFKMGLKSIGVDENSRFIMVGDDTETDIKGAQELGSEAILIYTGKTKYPLSPESKIRPNYEAKDLTEVIEILNNLHD
jgi:HAD superfamily hydrolase (TIGR01458 family)